jgi:hypothetical protein
MCWPLDFGLGSLVLLKPKAKGLFLPLKHPKHSIGDNEATDHIGG